MKKQSLKLPDLGFYAILQLDKNIFDT